MKSILSILLIAFTFVSFSQEMNINLKAVKITFDADMQNTSGSISGLQTKINFNMADLSKSSIAGTIDVAKLNTGNKKRDEHLKSADFFDVAKYPTMGFESQSFKKDGDTYSMTGMMSIRDVKRKETIVFTFANKVFKGTTTIQAALYGIFADKKPEKTNVKISFTIPVL